ncbi:hypothetical protein [Coralloluteibacterium thermophilus]|uniref:hypothetical protein n=1 Tax=Coralloluteibacterium thermophilum TaxID=2707049 RepID=UPI00366E0140
MAVLAAVGHVVRAEVGEGGSTIGIRDRRQVRPCLRGVRLRVVRVVVVVMAVVVLRGCRGCARRLCLRRRVSGVPHMAGMGGVCGVILAAGGRRCVVGVPVVCVVSVRAVVRVGVVAFGMCGGAVAMGGVCGVRGRLRPCFRGRAGQRDEQRSGEQGGMRMPQTRGRGSDPRGDAAPGPCLVGKCDERVHSITRTSRNMPASMW